jgi:flavin reductase (DIM6/NTAB) family NADH-FMN oxidoreductase RutF
MLLTSFVSLSTAPVMFGFVANPRGYFGRNVSEALPVALTLLTEAQIPLALRLSGEAEPRWAWGDERLVVNEDGLHLPGDFVGQFSGRIESVTSIGSGLFVVVGGVRAERGGDEQVLYRHQGAFLARTPPIEEALAPPTARPARRRQAR